MPTIKDVARRAGVSISTVSRTLSGKVPVLEETRQRVFQAINELNYQPNAVARGLKMGRSLTIGLMIPNFRSLVFPSAIKGITEVLNAYGYNLVICDTQEDVDREKHLIDNLNSRMVDGLICSTAVEDSEHIIELKEAGFPLVLLLRHIHNRIDAVIADNYAGGYTGGSYLLRKGFRRVALINGPLHLDIYRQRYNGFTQSLFDHNSAVDDKLVSHGNRGWEGGYRAMQELLDNQNVPEAVFATSDPKAFGAMKAIHERGLNVPTDISILGYDNLETSQLMSPPLTTIAQPFYEMGQLATHKLIELIDSTADQIAARKPVVDKLPVELIERDSVRLNRISI